MGDLLQPQTGQGGWVWVKPIAAIAQIVSGMLVWTELATGRSPSALTRPAKCPNVIRNGRARSRGDIELVTNRPIKAEPWRGARVAHVNSTFYGGGVAELLSSLTLLMSDAGLVTEWRAILGRSDYFSITKKMHNALQGAEIKLTELKMARFRNAERTCRGYAHARSSDASRGFFLRVCSPRKLEPRKHIKGSLSRCRSVFLG